MQESIPGPRSGDRGPGTGAALTAAREAGSADEAIEVIRSLKPDLVVCDLNMPGGGVLKLAAPAARRPTSSCSR